MPFKRSPMRFAHIVGYTIVFYQDDGNCIVSVGYDGDFRIWHGIGDDDPPTTCIGEHAWTALQYGDRVLIATDLNTVQACKYPSLEKDGIEFRFTAYVTCIAKNKRFLTAGSEDATIKVLSTDNGEQFELENLGGPVLCIDLSKHNLIAASIGDGTIRVWDMNTKELKKTIDGLPKVKSFEAVLHFSTPSFEPKTGSLMAYPLEKEVIVVNTKTWQVVKKFSKPKLSADLTVCAFSPMGDYLAAGSEVGEVIVWDFDTQKLIDGCAQFGTYPITRIVWNPKNNGELAVSDANGQIGTVTEIFLEAEEDDDGAGEDIVEMAEKEEEDGDDKMFDEFVVKETEVEDNDDNGDGPDDDELNENCVEIEKLKSQVLGPTQRAPENDALSDVDDDGASSVRSERFIGPKSFPQQHPFQPGSSPHSQDHCYLVYNHVGMVRRHATEKENSIEVEFHNSQQHHGIHLINYLNHTMAGLSETVLAMACSSDDGSPSKVVCINQASFGKREWSFTMPGCEDIVGVTASDKIVIVATDSRLLRVFTARGTQREILSIPGPIVALAAYGDHFLVAYHSAPANEDQNITLMIVTCINFKLRCREVRVPLTAGTELRWIGFSDRGSPVVYDTAGVLNLYHAASNVWFPIYHADNLQTKGASDSLFIIKVSESTQAIQLILCRGARYPLTNPKPVPMEVQFLLPLCDQDSEKEQLEEQLVRSLYFKQNNADKLIIETALKLFALACKNECEQRAKELVETIASSQLIPLAIKYASKIRRYHLADSLAPLLPTFQEQENQEEKLEQERIRESEAIVSELQHINIEAVTKKDTTPKIKPLPVGTKKSSNPFRKSTPAGGDSVASSSPASIPGGTGNPLEHLTGKAIGFSTSSNSSGSPYVAKAPANGGQVENRPHNNSAGTSGTPSGSGGGKFKLWFEQNQAELQQRHPEVESSELVRIGVREFRALQQKGTEGGKASKENGTPHKTSEKRKLDESEPAESGISKLAKFGFVQNN
ncbi:WD repeat and HMG-box DNA-binding protein 1 [Anopheles ziemanni]|uniref:WD repeat and HMG-box DNA-binding protein 1 n=1 Tax=Anopheles coustani TaxID=139045 RepID=UPI00265A4490|nr:WD repeat and HMG-box DNA-binding protein 1 [Anopheles coustani]XP_058167609.1 WD repeat and HMG-box DNA-binding protein 1 [Anopheles ziemanni]